MRVDRFYYGHDLQAGAASARHAQELEFDGWFTGQTSHDPFLMASQAAQQTADMDVGTAVVVAPSRSPMDVAYSANDLQLLSNGRFLLGLGTQVRAHIERRFGMRWSSPAARMREFIQALRAIWRAWNGAEALDFRGEFYTHTLMSQVFSPGPNPHGPPPVLLAAVGPRLTEVAGEVADGLHCHGFTTERYLRERTLPALERGLEQSGRQRQEIEVALPLFAIAGRTDEEVVAAEQAVREQVSFYASTPAYKPVLELHGWGELHAELHSLSRQQRWAEMARVLDDDVVAAFSVRGDPTTLAEEVAQRFAGLVDRVSFYTAPRFDRREWSEFLEAFRSLTGRPGSTEERTDR